MCLGNRAEASARYVDSQLGALYANAIACTVKHSTGLKPTESVVEYGTCLYEYYGPGKHARSQPSRHDLSFYAKFAKPHVEFVCNHEVILFINIQEGHYSLDWQKKGHHTHKQQHETLKPSKLAFRVEYATHSITDFHCAAIGNAENYTSVIHVLKLDSAIFVPEHSELSWNVTETASNKDKSKTTALTHYLTKSYLPTLKRAGHHVLYSLPDFDNLKVTGAHIDYSVINQRSLTTETIHGIHTEEINTFLRGLWLQAAAHIDEYGLTEQTVTESFLAELRTVGTTDDLHLHMQFGPLYVQPLCKREVILYVDVQDVLVHLGGFHVEHAHKLSNWKIALIVDIRFEENTVSGKKRIVLDLSHVRFCEHLSIFTEFQDVELFVRIKRTLIETITTYYVELLRVSETTVICDQDLNIWVPYDENGECEEITWDHEECTCEDESSCGHVGIRWGIINRRLITHTHTHEFDFVSALTQGGINEHFKSLWEVAQKRFKSKGDFKTWSSADFEEEVCLADYSFVSPDHGEEVFFASSFAAPKVQLRCKDGSYSVIFYVHLMEGYLKTLGVGKALLPGNEMYPFHAWRLAFEVDLVLVDTLAELVPASIRKRGCYVDVEVVKQLVLDFSTAKFNFAMSTVPRLTDGTDYRAIRARRQAIVHYVQHHYFKVLERANHHVLYTIPTLNRGIHCLKHFKFQVVPFAHGHHNLPLEGIYGPHSAIFARNSIVIVGMLGDHELPEGWLPAGINWVGGFRENIPHGAVCISHRVFLDTVILRQLEYINRQTTIIPTFTGVEDGEFRLELATWDTHPMKQRSKRANKCEWKKIDSSNGSLEYAWLNKEHWRYDHEGDIDGVGHYSVSCTTRNHLSLPTVRREPFAISVKGTMELALLYEGPGRDWSGARTASWHANIVFNSDHSGMRIHMSPPQITPALSHFTHTTNAQANAFKHFEKIFPSSLDFSHLVSQLKTSFEGVWAGSHLRSHELRVAHPVFTWNGDFLLELLPRSNIAPKHGLPISKPLYVNGKANGVNGTVTKANGSWIQSTGDAISYALGSQHTHSEAVSMSRTVSSTSEVSISSTSSYMSESSATSVNTLKHEDSISSFQNKSNGHAHLETTSINSNQLTQEELVEEL